MSFVSIIRDYVDMLNQISHSLMQDFTFKTFIIESFSYILQTVKIVILYIVSFQWVRDFTLLPTVIPSISSSIFQETFFLETPSKIFFEFLEIPSLDQNKFLLGFFNSFFMTLPISIIHIIGIRRLLIQGIPAGVFTISGYLLGQFLFLICVIFGIRFILIPWLTFEPLSYILGIILIFRILYPMVQEPLMPISSWDWKNSKYQNFFLTSFALAWCEQTAIFQYLGNISITSNPTILEGFSTNSSILSLLNHVNYLLGIFGGSIFFTVGWGFLFLKLPDFIVSYTPLLKSSFMQKLNTTTFVLTLAFTLSSIPYYGIDYLLTGPLGFVSQDQVFNKTVFSQYNLKDSVQALGGRSNFESLEIDVAPFDRGRYLVVPSASVFSFEDLNYKGEADWTTRQDKMVSLAHPNARRMFKFLKTNKSSPASTLSELDNFETRNSLDLTDPKDALAEISEPQNYTWADWYLVTSSQSQSPENQLFQQFNTLSFSKDFMRKKSKIEARVEKTIKEKYYSNPIYKNLLALDIDLFLNRQPTKFRLANNQELDLYEKRCKLTSYYDSLRAYKNLPNNEDFQKFFAGSKSFANKVYNQQFKGTLRSVRRLFALTLNDTNTDQVIKSQEQPQILKFDQPLYEFSSTEKFSPYHEELSDLQNSLESSAMKPYIIPDPLTRPLYAGWDSNLRKFVITNKLLSRNLAGYEMKINSKIRKNFSSESKKLTTLGSQKIKFTAWPLSPQQFDLPIDQQKISYVTLFVSQTNLKDTKVLDPSQFVLMPKMPANAEMIERRESPSQANVDNLFDSLAPKRGGFVWPGNSKFDFSSLPKP